VEDDHVFQADEGSKDLTRLAKNEGASWLLGHTSSLRHLRRARGDPGQDGLPARIRRAINIAEALELAIAVIAEESE
jgi:hypothetical protein